VLHEASGFVVDEGEHAELENQFLISVAGRPTRMPRIPVPANPRMRELFMEWSNALADIVALHSGELVACVFVDSLDRPVNPETVDLRVRTMFVTSDATAGPTAAIVEDLVQPGELTQSLCSPWQNDYQECACFYWAASRPDYVNVEHTATGARGDKWMARSRQREPYEDVPDITHEELFREWESLLRFVVGGRDAE